MTRLKPTGVGHGGHGGHGEGRLDTDFTNGVHRLPPLQPRGPVREGRRFRGRSIGLFPERPTFTRLGEFHESPIAKVTDSRTRAFWHHFRKRPGDIG